jgi:hypothetical protein
MAHKCKARGVDDKVEGHSSSCRQTKSGEGRTSSFGSRVWKTEGRTVVADTLGHQ